MGARCLPGLIELPALVNRLLRLLCAAHTHVRSLTSLLCGTMPLCSACSHRGICIRLMHARKPAGPRKELRVEHLDNAVLARSCTNLLTLNHQLFNLGHPEAAYHALEAAIHCAADAGDAPTLRRIEVVASAQRQALVERVSPIPPSDYGGLVEETRLASLERIYATAERTAHAKAAAVELRGHLGARAIV